MSLLVETYQIVTDRSIDMTFGKWKKDVEGTTVFLYPEVTHRYIPVLLIVRTPNLKIGHLLFSTTSLKREKKRGVRFCGLAGTLH